MVLGSLKVVCPGNDAFGMLGPPQTLVPGQIANTPHLSATIVCKFFARLTFNFNKTSKHEPLCAIFLVGQ